MRNGVVRHQHPVAPPQYAEFKKALKEAEDGGSPNNISAIIRYARGGGDSVMWMGDLETDFTIT